MGNCQDYNFQEKLNNLVDLAPKKRGKLTEAAQNEYLKDIMRQGGNKERVSAGLRNWEQDYLFYVDQKVFLSV